MTKIISGQSKTGKGLKIAVIVARFNEGITGRLRDACLDELGRLGVLKKDLTVVSVPGAFEIPVVAQKLAKKKTVDAVICLGAVILGETDHYRLVADNAAAGIMKASLDTGKPVVFEILATPTVKLAQDRAEAEGNNKGRDAAQVAVEMANVLSKL